MDWSAVFDPAVFDQGICARWCSRMVRLPTCLEEHEVWHVLWLQAGGTHEEYLMFRQRDN